MDSAAKTKWQSEITLSRKMSVAWLKMPIARLWDHNLFTVNAKADALARPCLTDACERSLQSRRRREGNLIIITRDGRAQQRAPAPQSLQGRRNRHLFALHDNADTGGRGEMFQIGDQAIGDVHTRMCDVAKTRAECHRRLWHAVAIRQIRPI